MREKIFGFGFVIILLFGFFSGCQEKEVEAASFEGVTLISDVVELVNASIKYHYNSFKEIWKVDVQYLFHNIAKKDIIVKVTIECYDKENNLVTVLGPKFIQLPIGYTEREIHPSINIVSYDGKNVDMIDHVIILASENT